MSGISLEDEKRLVEIAFSILRCGDDSWVDCDTTLCLAIHERHPGLLGVHHVEQAIHFRVTNQLDDRFELFMHAEKAGALFVRANPAFYCEHTQCQMRRVHAL